MFVFCAMKPIDVVLACLLTQGGTIKESTGFQDDANVSPVMAEELSQHVWTFVMLLVDFSISELHRSVQVAQVADKKAELESAGAMT